MGTDKNFPREQDLCPEFNPTHLSFNRQSDTRQQVTSSSYEWLGKARRKAEASEMRNARAKHNTKRKPCLKRSTRTKPPTIPLNQAFDVSSMISKAQQKADQESHQKD